jgi:hypothetical protein
MSGGGAIFFIWLTVSCFDHLPTKNQIPKFWTKISSVNGWKIGCLQIQIPLESLQPNTTISEQIVASP